MPEETALNLRFSLINIQKPANCGRFDLLFCREIYKTKENQGRTTVNLYHCNGQI